VGSPNQIGLNGFGEIEERARETERESKGDEERVREMER
jgi:hypothetical protein